jgi:protein-disulfide isomerase
MKKVLLILAMLVSRAQAGTSEGCVIAGPANAPVTIEEYVDFECVYCAKGADAMKQVLLNYPDKVKLVLRNLPLVDFHSKSLIAAKAFAAVWLQGPSLAYKFQENLFSNQARLQSEGEALLVEVAQRLGVDVAQMKTDMAGDKVATILAEDMALAKAYKFNGTPSFRIGNESITGSRPYSEYKAIIDRQLGN